MNRFSLLEILLKIVFDGSLQLDHMPSFDCDDNHRKIAWAHAVGDVQALLATLRG